MRAHHPGSRLGTVEPCLRGPSGHGAGVGQEPQEHDSDGYEHEPDEIVQVNAVPRTQGHPEEDRVEAVRVEPDDGGPDRDREDSEHPPQGSLRVPGSSCAVARSTW